MTADDLLSDDYDEFQFLERSAHWAGLSDRSTLPVHREEIRLSTGARSSHIRWGEDEPELVLLHGAGQNAHTWDTFAMAFGHPVVAIDLPGHGRSDWRDDRDYLPATNAAAVAEVIDRVAPRATAIVGMSLGGLTSVSLAARRPDLVRSLVLVDITPTTPNAAQAVRARPQPTALLTGPRVFASWDELVDAVHAVSPHRAREDVIPGVRNNSKRLEDGTWGWRYDSLFPNSDPRPHMPGLWQDLADMTAPTMLVRGALSPVVSSDAVAQFRRRVPAGRIETVAGAGHSVQSDKPVELAALIEDFV